MSAALYHLTVITPLTHAEAVRNALAQAGAGKMGEYDSCSFSTVGTGRFRPLEGADPHIGKAGGGTETVEEERIETIVTEPLLPEVLRAVTAAHPYEEPAIYLVPMANYHDYLR